MYTYVEHWLFERRVSSKVKRETRDMVRRVGGECADENP